jgi:tagaturonate reductase
MKTPILQFGTSRFLQAHADLFVSEALDQGQAIGPVTIVQTSGDPGRATRVGALAAPDGFPVIIRGMEENAPVEREVRVRSVRRALSTATDWDEVRRVFVEEAEVVLSNTGDKGYALAEQDSLQGVPKSFPMKLLALLQARHKGGGRALTILPCELISRNGDVLKAIVLRLAAGQGVGADFETWLSTDVIWANSLVDRIVSEPIEPAGAIAEPYALWAIEQQPGLVVPCTHPAILLVPDLTPYEKLKLHILNLGHTLLAERWLKDDRPAGETVREILQDDVIAEYLNGIYENEVIPGFDSHSLGDEARAYVETTLARFRNPYLQHRLSDIAGNHAEKIQRRFVGFMDWCPGIAMPELKRIAEG